MSATARGPCWPTGRRSDRTVSRAAEERTCSSLTPKARSRRSRVFGVSATNTARNQEHPSGVEALHRAPPGRDQKIGRAVAVDVSHRDGVEPERVTRRSAGIRLYEVPVLARVEIRAAARGRAARVLPRTDDEIGVAVSVHVPGD